MINLNTSIKHLIKVTNKKNNEEIYYVLTDEDKKWQIISQDEYNKMRSNNGE